MTPEQAINAVNTIIDDLTDRRGLRHAWDEIDEDIKGEIQIEWMRLILEAVKPV